MEAEIILLGPRKRCWNLQVKALYFFKTRGNAGLVTLLHSRRLYLQQFDCEDATSHIMFFSVLCLT